MFIPLLLLGAVITLAVIHIRHLIAQKRRLPEGSRPLPGPKGLPFIGRVHDMPSESTWLKFYDWSKTYGPIYQMEIFGSVHVWISSEKVAHDLLSKRNTIYSDRPQIPNLPDNRTSGDYLALLGHTGTWKRQRKFCHHLMATSAADSLHGYPTRERDRFLYLMSQDPDNYVEWIEQLTSRTVSRLSWGSAHPAMMLRDTTARLLESISPGGALPNVVSWLAHLPAVLSPWKQKENARHRLEEKAFKENVQFVQDMRAKGLAAPSFIKTFLDDKARKERVANEKEVKTDGVDGVETGEAMRVVGQVAIAGALTTGSPIQTYLLAMCHYPDWQRRLQDEIDRVCEGRCPQWGDRERLPLLRAVVKEVIRWRPPVPTGIPHALEQDDVYNGYHIPAGATIHALEWGMTRDETVYPNAEMFNPNRWLSPEYPTYKEPLTQHPNLSGFSQFGFGRRTCQGVPIVEQDLFLSMGGMAWAFSIQKRRDAKTDVDIPVHWNSFTALLIAKPVKFEFDAVVRGEGRKATLRAMYDAAKEDDEDYVVEGDADSESDHDVRINIRESSPAPSDSAESSDWSHQESNEKRPVLRKKLSVPGAWS